jgi:hypothetical protein
MTNYFVLQAIYFASISLGLIGCSKNIQTIELGKTSRAELLLYRGEPQAIEKPQSSIEVMVYDKDLKYQISDNLVTHSMRNPTEAELHFLYWQNKFKNCETQLIEQASDPSAHMLPNKEFKCDSLGLSIIYDPNVDQVIRIIEYAQKN